MLYWKANFSIPNSGVQAAEVFVKVTSENNQIVAESYSDVDLKHLMFTKQYAISDSVKDYEDYLLSLDEYVNYTKI
jgi:hypothetical protein